MITRMQPPPYRIETQRLTLRCYDPADAPLLKDCVDASLPQLRPWLPWADDEPQPIDQKIQLLRQFRSQFDADADYVMGMFEPDGSQQVGGSGLHPRIGPDALEIGYFLRTSATGRGLATEAVAVLTDIGLRYCGAERIEVHIEPGNTASLPIPRRLGFVDTGIVAGDCQAPDGDRDVIVFQMAAGDWSPGLAPRYQVFDAAGRLVDPPS